jgi:hypothetical protein
MVFFNTSDRRLEGEFSFPLPEGALVNGYALDVHDVMAEGVIVERTRARQVYEAIVARDVDPGLMEWVKGNLFHTRIFPIPELGSRRVRLCFVQQLPAEDGECLFRLPLRFSSAVDEATCRITVWDTDTQPGLQCSRDHAGARKWKGGNWPLMGSSPSACRTQQQNPASASSRKPSKTPCLWFVSSWAGTGRGRAASLKRPPA